MILKVNPGLGHNMVHMGGEVRLALLKQFPQSTHADFFHNSIADPL